jgi:hypothetical protein
MKVADVTHRKLDTTSTANQVTAALQAWNFARARLDNSWTCAQASGAGSVPARPTNSCNVAEATEGHANLLSPGAAVVCERMARTRWRVVIPRDVRLATPKTPTTTTSQWPLGQRPCYVAGRCRQNGEDHAEPSSEDGRLRVGKPHPLARLVKRCKCTGLNDPGPILVRRTVAPTLAKPPHRQRSPRPTSGP